VSVRYTVPEGILDREIGDELLVHRFDTDEVFVLNAHARIVFDAVKETASGEEVRELVASRVFGDTLEIYQAVDRALELMVEEGLLLKAQDAGA
jgi:hypothetical protein